MTVYLLPAKSYVRTLQIPGIGVESNSKHPRQRMDSNIRVTPYFAMAILGIPAARGGVLGMPQAGDICAAGTGPKSGS